MRLAQQLLVCGALGAVASASAQEAGDASIRFQDPQLEGGAGVSAALPLQVLDLDGDGAVEIIHGSDTEELKGLVILARDGARPGRFRQAAMVAPTLTRGQGVLAVGDVNADGRLDLVTLSRDKRNVQVHVGTEQPFAFAPPELIPAPDRTSSVLLVDLGGNGRLDMLVNGFMDMVSRRQDADQPGVFLAPVSLGMSQAVDRALGDLDGDGRLDLVTASLGKEHLVTVWLQSADQAGGFAARVHYSANREDVLQTSYDSIELGPVALALEDFDGDGLLDVAVNYHLALLIYPNDAEQPGRLGAPLEVPLPKGVKARGIAVGDLNRDGRPDIVFADAHKGTVLGLLQAPGDRLAFKPAVSWATGLLPRAVALADVDGDGLLDIIALNSRYESHRIVDRRRRPTHAVSILLQGR
jgi:hypothetical protein